MIGQIIKIKGNPHNCYKVIHKLKVDGLWEIQQISSGFFKNLKLTYNIDNNDWYQDIECKRLMRKIKIKTIITNE